MRDLIGKLFGQSQEEEPAKESPEEGSGIDPKKIDTTPLNAETVDVAREMENESLIVAPPADQHNAENDVFLVNEQLISAGIPQVDGVMEESNPAIAVEEEAIDHFESRQLAIDETAVSGNTLQPDEVKKPVAMLQAAHYCHIGNIRTRNEDSTYIFTAEAGGEEPLIPFGLYVLADGMGGHHAGHTASKDVSRIVAQNVLERIYLPLIKKSTNTITHAQEPIHDVMVDAIQIANEKIHNPEPGMDSGTTLTAILVFGRRMYITHIGDSRAYLMSEGQLKQLTTDHSYVRRLIEAGQITEKEASVHPQRNMLYRAVGQGGILEVDTFTQKLPQNGTLILCSDGLWGLVPDTEITKVVQEDVSLGEKADELIGLALQAGGHDNISAILVSFCF